MQVFSTIRRFVPLAAVVVLVVMASCNGSSKKYGCPNKLHTSAFTR